MVVFITLPKLCTQIVAEKDQVWGWLTNQLHLIHWIHWQYHGAIRLKMHRICTIKTKRSHKIPFWYFISRTVKEAVIIDQWFNNKKKDGSYRSVEDLFAWYIGSKCLASKGRHCTILHPYCHITLFHTACAMFCTNIPNSEKYFEQNLCEGSSLFWSTNCKLAPVRYFPMRSRSFSTMGSFPCPWTSNQHHSMLLALYHLMLC